MLLLTLFCPLKDLKKPFFKEITNVFVCFLIIFNTKYSTDIFHSQIPKKQTTSAKLVADDVSYFSVVDNLNLSLPNLNVDLTKMNVWMNQWKISFNSDLK